MNAKKNPSCVYLNKFVTIWFELCKKHNIKLALLFNNINLSKSYNEYVYIKSRNIVKISNFKKFLCAPNTLDNDEFFIENIFARNYIKQIIRLSLFVLFVLFVCFIITFAKKIEIKKIFF